MNNPMPLPPIQTLLRFQKTSLKMILTWLYFVVILNLKGWNRVFEGLGDGCYRTFFFLAISIVCMSNSVSEILYFTLNVFNSSNFNSLSCVLMSFNL